MAVINADANTTAYYTVTNLEEGNHGYYVWCNDTAGNYNRTEEIWFTYLGPFPEANFTPTWFLDDELMSNSRGTCEDSQWLRIDSFVQQCAGPEGAYTPTCYWINTSRLYYCANGCYENINEYGDGCAPTEFTIYAGSIILFLASIGAIGMIYGKKKRGRR